MDLSDISQPAGGNLGGISGLSVCPVDGVASIPDILNNAISGNVTFKSGFAWYSIYCSQESMNYQEPTKIAGAVTIYEPKFTGSVPKDIQNVSAILEEYEGRRIIAKYTDINGNTILLGTLDSPLKFTSVRDTGQRPGTFNGYKITLSGLQSDRAPFYSGT